MISVSSLVVIFCFNFAALPGAPGLNGSQRTPGVRYRRLFCAVIVRSPQAGSRAIFLGEKKFFVFLSGMFGGFNRRRESLPCFRFARLAPSNRFFRSPQAGLVFGFVVHVGIIQ